MKYIIESNDVIGYTPKYAMLFGDGYMIQPLEDLEELNSDYINEHYGQMQDEAYQRGLEDAWEAAKKLFSSMADSDIEKAFPIEWNNGGFKALMNLQPQEAIAKLKAYEDKQKDRIEVGDEVVFEKEGAEPFVILYKYYDDAGYPSEYMYFAYAQSGEVLIFNERNRPKKTGRHFQEINKLLEAMRA